MVIVTITKRDIDAAKRAGACLDGVQYSAGTNLSEISVAHLGWFALNCPRRAEALRKEACSQIDSRGNGPPLEMFGSGSGSGYGSGYGYGDGDGYGSGYGDGYGYGYGYGSGDGSGDSLEQQT